MSPTEGKGSFRGVPFLTSREQRERGGRNVVRREYPLSEKGGSDDLGPKLPEYTFTVIVMGEDVDKQRRDLRKALRAPGPGELIHPDFGTLNVLISSFESRYNASERGVVEFTMNVIPASDDTAPAARQDTAAVLGKKSSSALGGVFTTLAQGWSVVTDGLHDVQAMADTLSEKISALENAVSGAGIIQDISVFASTFSALRGNITGLITTPGRIAQGMAGIFSGLIALPTLPSLTLLKSGNARQDRETPSGSLAARDATTEAHAGTQMYRTLAFLNDTLAGQDGTRDLTGLSPQTQGNIRLLQSVLLSAVTLSQIQVASQLLDLAVDLPATDRPGAVAPDAGEPAAVPLLESAGDVAHISHTLGQALDAQVLALSARGHTPAALMLREVRLALTADFTTRGVRLPGARAVYVRTTEPALVTLYRATGDSRQWRRFVRRNGITDPSFVPGGETMEVIDEQPR